ncbi:CPBP family intramembrane glutamic endopeptidase [Verrucomicrobiota bacterium sgz303538]
MLLAAIVTAFWPERVFKYAALNWWRRAVFSAALCGVWIVGAGIAETIVNLPFFAAFRPEAGATVSVYSLGREFIEAIIFLLPWFLLPRLREAIDLRVRWSWIALVFAVPVVSCLPRSFFEIRGLNWNQVALFFSYCMLIGVVEEALFRGYAFQLRPERRPKETIFVTSIMFAYLHLPKILEHDDLVAWQILANAFFCGIGLGIIRLSTGSIGLCIVIHGAIDIFLLSANPSNLALLAFAASTMAALYFHPSCRRVAGFKSQVLCGANA